MAYGFYFDSTRCTGCRTCEMAVSYTHLGMNARGIVSDEGTYNDQLWYDIREIAGRTHDFWNIAIGAVPDLSLIHI